MKSSMKKQKPLAKYQTDVRVRLNDFYAVMEKAFNELTPEAFYDLESRIVEQIKTSRTQRMRSKPNYEDVNKGRARWTLCKADGPCIWAI